jgi:hypothetical protein
MERSAEIKTKRVSHTDATKKLVVAAASGDKAAYIAAREERKAAYTALKSVIGK